jgi:hypothetical protein
MRIYGRDIRAVEARIGIGKPLKVVRWALRFIEEPLDDRSVGALYELWCEWLSWFSRATGLGLIYHDPEGYTPARDVSVAEMLEQVQQYGPPYVETPEQLDLAEIQGIMRATFQAVADGKRPDTIIAMLRDHLPRAPIADQLRYAVMATVASLGPRLSIRACEGPRALT